MKTIYTTIFCCLFICGFAQDVAFTIDNEEITVMGLDSFYEADIRISSQTAGGVFTVGSGQVYINYNTAAFGENVETDGNLEVLLTDDYLLSLRDNVADIINVYSPPIVNDNTENRFSVAWQQDRAAGCINFVLDGSPMPLFRVRLKFAPDGSSEIPDLCFEDDNIFVNQTFSACGPNDCGGLPPADCTGEPGMVVIEDMLACNAYAPCTGNTIPTASTLSFRACQEEAEPWIHLSNGVGEILVSVLPGNNNLGEITAELYKDPAPITVNSMTFLERHYRINTERPPVTPVSVRFYFSNPEFTSLVDAAALTPPSEDDVTSIAQLGVTRYSGPTEDGTYDDSDAVELEVLEQQGNDTGFGENYIEVQTSGFSEFWIHRASILPVELLNFEANSRATEVALNWTTATEQNCDYFEIQRRRGLEDFEVIGATDCYGNSQILQSYNFIDERPLSGTSYYRLRQVDEDGAYMYSAIEAVTRELIADVEVYPNPTKNRLNVRLTEEYSGEFNISIINTSGVLISTQKEIILSGQEQISLSVESLPEGMYFLSISSRGQFAGTVLKRFVKIESN